MFTIEQIKNAHSKVKSGADFPNYIQELIKLGVTEYICYVNDGHTEYFSKNNYKIKSDSKYGVLNVSETSDINKFKSYLKMHQQGQTDYLTFCQHSAETGVEKWVVDTEKMTCIYYDKSNNTMLKEDIPIIS